MKMINGMRKAPENDKSEKKLKFRITSSSVPSDKILH